MAIYDLDYHHISLRKNGKGKIYPVHRLVGLTFIPNHDDKPIVDHIDGDPSNSNLRWASYEESVWNTKCELVASCVCDLVEGKIYNHMIDMIA